jgi:hypothetical protein
MNAKHQGPQHIRLSTSTHSRELAASIAGTFSNLELDSGLMVDISLRFLTHFAGVGQVCFGDEIGEDRVVEIVNFDPVRGGLVSAGTADPYPWAPFHWLVFKTCPEQGAVVQVYRDVGAGKKLVLDAEGISGLSDALKRLRKEGFVSDPRLGAVAVGRDLEEAVDRLNKDVERTE